MIFIKFKNLYLDLSLLSELSYYSEARYNISRKYSFIFNSNLEEKEFQIFGNIDLSSLTYLIYLLEEKIIPKEKEFYSNIRWNIILSKLTDIRVELKKPVIIDINYLIEIVDLKILEMEIEKYYYPIKNNDRIFILKECNTQERNINEFYNKLGFLNIKRNNNLHIRKLTNMIYLKINSLLN